MGMEKKRSKGSFLSLFDWNAKSRKKLIWNSPTLPEVSKQGKENVENMPKSQINRMMADENGASPSNTASSDFNCAVSTCSDEGCGSKAPGLVARLMGLDSLPSLGVTVTEISSTSLYGSNSRGASHFNEGAFHSVDDFHPADYMSMPLKVEKSSWDAMEPRAQKVENRPIKKFQTEMLPPKSAKSIPVTHNKLLSPIRSPGFMPPKNAAHIMEAAAKIIESSPRPYMRNRMSPVGPSSVPLRILDLKERLEAAQYASVPEKLVERSITNSANGKPRERSSNLYKCTPPVKGSRDSEKNSSHHSATKGKSISLTTQAKTSVQSKDTSTSNGTRRSTKQKEQNEIMSDQLSRSQKSSTHRAVQQKTFTSRKSHVLGQNNQKQNSVTNNNQALSHRVINKGKSTSKINSNKPTTQTSSSESSSGIRKATSKGSIIANVQPKRSGMRAADTQKEFPPSKTESISQKKRYISGDVHEARGPDNAVNNFESRSIKCNFTTEGSVDQDAFNMKESKDVVSFTFTSPLRRSMPESPSSTEELDRIGVNFIDHGDRLHPKKLSLSPPGLHMIDGDALSVLLEKKLQELTSRINLPQCTLATEESSTGSRSSLQDKVASLVSTASREQDRSFHPVPFNDKLDSMHNYRSSSDDPVLSINQQLQTSEVMEDPGYSSNSGSGNDLRCQHFGAVSVFETPSVSENYLDSEDSAYGSTVYSSVQDEEVSNCSQANESASLENEVKWSAQSSVTLAEANMSIEQSSARSNSVDFRSSKNMELEYVQDILSNAEFTTEEFVVGQTNTVIMPNLFDLLENQSYETENCAEEYTKLERKVLFDCVTECLELRCSQAFVGNCKSWPRWAESIQKKGWLAEELCKEMQGYRSMEEVMVDELVGKDMSTGCGKWLDFDIEAFEEGLEVEQEILTYLIDELVCDFSLV